MTNGFPLEVKAGSEVWYDNTWWICNRVWKNRIMLTCQDAPSHKITISKDDFVCLPTVHIIRNKPTVL